MANEFSSDISSPMGAAEEYLQQISKTQIMGAEAQRQQIGVQQDQLKLKETYDTLLEHEAFSSKVKQMSPTLQGTEKLSAMADAAIAAGDYTDADKVLGVLAKFQQSSALNEYRSAQAEQARAGAEVKRMTMMGDIYARVDSPESKAAADAVYKRVFGRNSDIADMPYSEGLIKALDSGMKTQIAKARIAELSQRAVHEVAAAKTAELNGQAVRKLNEAKTEAVEKKAAIEKKTGGKITSASKEEVDSATAMIKDQYPDLDNPKVAALEIASEAKGRMIRGDAASYSEAVRQVVDENPQRFKEKKNGLFTKDSITYSNAKTPGGKPSTPAPTSFTGKDKKAYDWAQANKNSPNIETAKNARDALKMLGVD